MSYLVVLEWNTSLYVDIRLTENTSIDPLNLVNFKIQIGNGEFLHYEEPWSSRMTDKNINASKVTLTFAPGDSSRIGLQVTDELK